eukprot:gnl/Hemi2/26295_TR8826_c1_g2_i1.p1 gnl/Hemi2/26295_TR8826_c1_g2~~gnl/Hemi2/26295_TR8826_c1_g2_i1.p1  ORF type:complete len:302 (-),score=-8.13 gnl/Hemi2/26295_TR8826_c1_g2_i1:4-879(-)
MSTLELPALQSQLTPDILHALHDRTYYVPFDQLPHPPVTSSPHDRTPNVRLVDPTLLETPCWSDLRSSEQASMCRAVRIEFRKLYQRTAEAFVARHGLKLSDRVGQPAPSWLRLETTDQPSVTQQQASLLAQVSRFPAGPIPVGIAKTLVLPVHGLEAAAAAFWLLLFTDASRSQTRWLTVLRKAPRFFITSLVEHLSDRSRTPAERSHVAACFGEAIFQEALALRKSWTLRDKPHLLAAYLTLLKLVVTLLATYDALDTTVWGGQNVFQEWLSTRAALFSRCPDCFHRSK